MEPSLILNLSLRGSIEHFSFRLEDFLTNFLMLCYNICIKLPSTTFATFEKFPSIIIWILTKLKFLLVFLIIITGIVRQSFTHLLLFSQLSLKHSLETLFFCRYWDLLNLIAIILRNRSCLFHLWFLNLLLFLLLYWLFYWGLVTLWLIRVFGTIRLLLLLITFWRLRRILRRHWRLIILNIFTRISLDFLHRICIVTSFLL